MSIRDEAMIGSNSRSKSFVSCRTIVLAMFCRPFTGLPFITAVFISRTVSSARRTISSASSIGTSPVTSGPNSNCSSSSATTRTGSVSGA